MSSALYVGRVGALAIALGIGAVIAGLPGVAWAGPEGEPDPSDPPGVSAPENPDGAGDDVSGQDVGGSDPGDPDDGDDQGGSAGGMKVESSGGALTSTKPGSVGTKSKQKDRDPDPSKKRSTAKSNVFSLAPQLRNATPPTAKKISDPGPKVRSQPAVLDITPPTDPGPRMKQAGAPTVDEASLTRSTLNSRQPITTTMTAVTKPLAQPLVSRWLSLVTLASTTGGSQLPSTDSPLVLGFLTAARKVDEDASIEDESSARMAGSAQNSFTLMAAAANSAPTAKPSTDTPNEVTGEITGNVNAADAEQNPLTYTISAQPSRGVVSVDGAGAFKYTPTQAERLKAGQTAGADLDSFTITVADDQGGATPVTVQVGVLPAVTASTPDIALAANANPSAVAVNGNLAYVADATARTVKVVNTATNQVVATIPVQTSPSAIAVSPDGNSVWVANSGSRTVQRIDTRSNTVTATVTVGTTPTALAVTGDSVWVANAGSNNVTRINTSTLAVKTINVGLAPSAIAVSGDRVFVANKNSNSISVISTTSNTVVSTKTAVTAPSALAVTDGKLYVAQQSLNRVLVLNSTTMSQITAISVNTAPTSIAITKDGSLAYVANSNDRLSVIDTKANTVISTLIVGTPGTSGGHTVAVDQVGGNTGVYVTDAVDKKVRRWSLPRGNTAPVAVGSPTVEAAADGSSVTGLLNVKDWDGDSLTYAVSSQPTSTTVTGVPLGNVSVTSGGNYAYTPDPAARDKAAQTGTADSATFTVRATDSLGATNDVTVTVPIMPTPVANRAPQAGTPSIDTQNGGTGAVSGLLNFTDPDGNAMTYSAPTQPPSGTVTFVGSRYTFTPYQSARDAAAISDGPDAVDITVVASDGQLSTPVTFSVPVLPPNPPNQAPVHGTPTVDTIVNSTGAVSGNLNFTDPNNDSMTYSVPVQPASGTVTFSGSRYTFTPTAAARVAAAASRGADPVTITVVASDGVATDTVTFTVPIMQSSKATNQTPWVPGDTIPRTLDPVSGSVTGYMNVQDADGDTLIYTLASPPTQGGTVTFDQRSGYFTYTPGQAARAQAAQTPGLDYDTFGVNITDGTATVNTTVTVQVAPALPPVTAITNNPVAVGAGPSGVAVSNGYSYVVNYAGNTVTVTDTATNQVVKTIDVGAGPLSVAAVDSAQRKRVYVSNSMSNTVTVIDASTNKVVDTITVDIPPGVYENPEWGTFEYQQQITEIAASGNRLYVNASDGTLRVYDTTNDAKVLLRTESTGTFYDLELSPDGTRLYGTSGSVLTVFDTATMAAVPVTVGPGSWDENAAGNRAETTNGVGNVAVSPDGKRAYVTYGVSILERGVGGQPYGSFVTRADGTTWMYTGGYQGVSVIDTDPASPTYNKEIARLQVPLGVGDLAVGAGKLYVTNSDEKSVTIIDTVTNRIVGSFATDQSTATRDPIFIAIDGYPMFYVWSWNRYITVGPNGTVYVTDYGDGKMYAVTVGSQTV